MIIKISELFLPVVIYVGVEWWNTQCVVVSARHVNHLISIWNIDMIFFRQHSWFCSWVEVSKNFIHGNDREWITWELFLTRWGYVVRQKKLSSSQIFLDTFPVTVRKWKKAKAMNKDIIFCWVVGYCVAFPLVWDLFRGWYWLLTWITTIHCEIIRFQIYNSTRPPVSFVKADLMKPRSF